MPSHQFLPGDRAFAGEQRCCDRQIGGFGGRAAVEMPVAREFVACERHRGGFGRVEDVEHKMGCFPGTVFFNCECRRPSVWDL